MIFGAPFPVSSILLYNNSQSIHLKKKYLCMSVEMCIQNTIYSLCMSMRELCGVGMIWLCSTTRSLWMATGSINIYMNLLTESSILIHYNPLCKSLSWLQSQRKTNHGDDISGITCLIMFLFIFFYCIFFFSSINSILSSQPFFFHFLFFLLSLDPLHLPFSPVLLFGCDHVPPSPLLPEPLLTFSSRGIC